MATERLVISMENPENFTVLDINSRSNPVLPGKQKAKVPKQFILVLLLKTLRTIPYILLYVVSLVKKREENSEKREPQMSGKLLMFIKGFLSVSLLALFLHLVVQAKGWNPDLFSPWEEEGFLDFSYFTWITFREDYIVPLVIGLSKFCTVLFLIQSLDRLVLCLGCLWIKCNGVKPTIEGQKRDPEDCSGFPMVLVQIPMCNEREVYAQSISAVCQLDWPKDRFLVQILDDSDEENICLMIKNEVSSWKAKGVNIIYRHRNVRTGYKAGNLKSAMGCEYVKNYEFVAIFDADFQPKADFLKLTIPHFKGNPELGLVQARWSFVNRDENWLTRLQNINMCFHFEVEQQVNGVFLNFFGFNGTAGVWRIEALEDSGGWLERTTVEDMDIAVRAHLNGWKFIFLNDLEVPCELPESYEAYKKQQHRWHSGPMQLFQLCLPSIVTSKKVSFINKFNLIFLFFLLRKLILPFCSFTLFCVILPMSMFIPEAEVPLWVISVVPIVMSLLSILPSPKSFPFLVAYLLFENTISVTKFGAMVSGLFQLPSAYEWVVTKKTGRSFSESDLFAIPRSRKATLDSLKEQKEVALVKKRKKIYKKELVLAFLLLVAAARSVLSGHGVHFYFFVLQGLSFLIAGLDLIGEQTN